MMTIQMNCWTFLFSVSMCFFLSSPQAATLQSGDLVVSEFLANPAALSDTRGEWVEIFNTTGSAIDLRGITLADDDSDAHLIDAATPLLIAPGGYFVLARSPLAGQSGVTPDYVYDGHVLGNGVDEIVLRQGAKELWRVEYDATLAAAGQSAELIAFGLAGGGVYGLTPATFQFSAGGDIGSPGLPGSFDPGVAAVPLPTPLILFVSGLLGMIAVARRHGASVRRLSFEGRAAPLPDAVVV